MENNKKNMDISEEIIERPSPETFAKWREMGEARYEKRKRRNKTIISCTMFLLVCVGSLIAVKFINPPVVEAGLEGKLQIDDSMERTVEYASWADLPDELKDTFIEVKDLPGGLEVEWIEASEMKRAVKIAMYLHNEEADFVIRQYANSEGNLPSNMVVEGNEEEQIQGVNVYIEKNPDYETITYKYLSRNIIIDVVAPHDISLEIIEDIIKAVQ